MQSSSDIVWSIIWMIAILLVGVTYSIYWIFTYDEKNPNPLPTIDTEPSDGVSGETATLSRDVAGQQWDDQQLDAADEAVGTGADNEGS